MFDAISPAVVASDHTISELLEPARACAARRAARSRPGAPRPRGSNRGDPGGDGADEGDPPYEAEIRRAVRRVAIDRLMALADGAAMPQVRAIATAYLEGAGRLLAEQSAALTHIDAPFDAPLASERLLALDISRFLERPVEPYGVQSAPDAPPGAPIGMGAMDFLGGSGVGVWGLSAAGRAWEG